jgi:carboxymethylenebutenolidase
MEFKNEIEELVHLHEDGALNRRDLLRRVAAITGSLPAALAAVSALGVPQQAQAQEAQPVCPENARVSADSSEVNWTSSEFPGRAGRLYGHLATPNREYRGPMPAILVIHENRGLNEHIKDVTRRLARQGYVALGIDLLSRQGSTEAFPDPVEAGRAYGRVTAAEALEDMQSALEFLRTLEIVRAERLGAIGFCAGGGNCFNLAVNQPDLAAAVVYYGMPPNPIDQLENLQTPVLMHFGELDRNFTQRVPAIVQNLNDRRKPYELHVYQGVGHAFNNDTGTNFNARVACEAWKTTLAFFARTLNRE